MRTFSLAALLFTVIFLEGYVVLSTELLAIRQTIPFVGSGTDTISVIIAAVLMPLAFGYHAGGQFRPGFYNGRFVSIRAKLLRNLLISQIILLVGLSYFLLTLFFEMFTTQGIVDRLILVSAYSALFLVTPVYLLGQTIPLISNYFSKEELSRITGKMLFLSTIGSFTGAVFSTLVLMSFVGVHHTAALNFVLLALLITLLSKKRTSEIVIVSWVVALIGLGANSDFIMRSLHIVENNKYNTVAVFDMDGERHMILNNNASSMMADDGRRHEYIQFMERVGIMPIWKSDPPREILVIGAGAFTIGYPDHNNHYDFVDIDGSLKEIAEQYILKAKLTPNKEFHPIPARSFLTQNKKQYDVIVLDAYLGSISMPEHLATREFFVQVRDALKPGGLVMANFITSASFANPFSRNIDMTFRSVFPYTTRHVIDDQYDLWSDKTLNDVNSIYIYKDQPDARSDHIYTDNKNTLFMDKPRELLR